MRAATSCWLAGLALLFLDLIFPFRAGALGGGHHDHYWVSHDPSIGYAVPIQRVYQFPAPFVFQPGPEPLFGGVFYSAYDQYAGPSFIPR